jgi:hypothetical protein
VEYTVNQLIQEARDPDNLAKIFVGEWLWQYWGSADQIGWQPWL